MRPVPAYFTVFNVHRLNNQTIKQDIDKVMPVATSLTKNPPANGFKMSVWCVQPFFKGLKIWPLFPFLQQLHGAIPQWKTRRDAFRNLTKHEKDWGAFIIFYHLLSSTSALIHTNILHGDGGVWPKSCDVTWQLLPTVIQADFPVQGTKTCAGHMYKKTSRSHPLKSPKNPQLCKRFATDHTAHQPSTEDFPPFSL